MCRERGAGGGGAAARAAAAAAAPVTFNKANMFLAAAAPGPAR